MAPMGAPIRHEHGRRAARGDDRPQQAVILAGGRGSRLRPLTDVRPKPLISFHGKPFLGYLLDQLRDQGITRVLLLLGYLAEQVREYCGDGRRWGLQIDYFISDVEDETGRRLALAYDALDPVFLLMYCDNYCPLQLDALWERSRALDSEVLLTIYRNADRYTRDNVRLDRNGRIEVYDKDRSARDLAGVEIGYAIVHRSAIERLPGDNVSFERFVYPQLASEGHLGAFVTDHRYYSVSSIDRLPTTEQFLARRPTVIVDRDGVLNRKPPKAQYVCSWDEWHWLPGALEALRVLTEAGFRIILVSNQAGIARGALTEDALHDIHRHMMDAVRSAGGEIEAIYFCPHGWDEGCACRKPRPGMLYHAQRHFHLDLTRTPVIGDDERDGQAADAAGCPFLPVTEQRGLLDVAHALVAQPREASRTVKA